MGYNKIPLALGFNDSTGNASGLVEFTLNLSDVGDACSSAPEEGQALVYNADGKWCPANVGAGTFSGNLSDVGQVCDNQPTNGQSLVWSGGVTGSWCPSTVATGGGGGGIPDPGGSASDVLAYNGSDWVAASREVLNLAIVNQANTFTQTNIFGGATAASQTNINGSTGNVTVGSAGNTTTIATNGQLSVGTTGANQIVLNVVSGVIVGDNTDPDHVDIQTDGTVFVGSATGDGSGIALYSTGKISFPVNTTEAALTEAGDVGWDSGSETLALKLNGVIAHVAEDSLIRVRNQTGSAINSFSAVYVSGVQGENPAIALANNTLSQSTQRILGVTMGSISDGGTGFIITKGLLKNVNTSLFTSGNLLYVASGGAVTSAIPDHPNSIIRLGKVLKQDATEGIVLVEVQHGFAANEIDNITADANSVMFTDSASSVSSLSGASGSIVYFENEPPEPGLKTFSGILSNENYNIEPGKTYVTDDGLVSVTGPFTINTTTLDDSFLIETTEDSQDAAPVITLKRSSSVFPATNGDYFGQLKFKGESNSGVERVYAKLSAKARQVTNGSENGLLEVMVRNTGSNLITTRFKPEGIELINGTGMEIDGTLEVTGTLDVTGNSTFTSGSITNTPTAANHIANKSYVDSQVGSTPSYFMAHADGDKGSISEGASTLIHWVTSGTYGITDPAGNIEVDASETPDPSTINVSGDGVYQIDWAARGTQSTYRLGLVLRIYRDPGTGTFAEIPEFRTANYVSRGTGSSEGIGNGTCTMSALLSLDNGDRLRFGVSVKTSSGQTATINGEGTYLRITKVG